jgi:hypothetical protein
VRFWPIILCLALCDCRAGAEQNLQAAEASPPDRGSIGKNVDAVVQEYKLEVPIEISSARAASPLAPGDWIVCLRGNSKQRRLTVAAFYLGSEKIAAREALAADQCEHDSYRAWKKK